MITQKEARTHLEHILNTVQKFRSDSAEAFDLTPSSKYAKLFPKIIPYVFDTEGGKCLVPTLTKMLEQDNIEPMSFYNIMYICKKLEPSIGAIVALIWKDDLVKPTMDIFRELEKA